MHASAFLIFAGLTSALPRGGQHPARREHEPLVRTLYQYPVGTWIENIAVRDSGELLLTLLNTPELEQLDPFAPRPEPQKVARIAGVTGLSGIAQIAPESFAVAAGNFSLATGEAAVGSWSVRRVDFDAAHGVAVTVGTIADLPTAAFLNGMCALPPADDDDNNTEGSPASSSSSSSTNNILVGDIKRGVVSRLDTTTGAVALVLNDSLTAARPDPIFGSSGVDGIRVHGGALYFANPLGRTFARVPIHPRDGTPAGRPEVIQRAPEQSELRFYYDDFAIRGGDAYLVTGAGNSVERVGLRDGAHRGRVVAGGLNSTQFAEPTSAAFGRTERDRDILYVVTAGGLATPVDGNITVGAQVLAVDTSRWVY
ncbi:hypothetical protein GGR56DRAFT_666546 [Xylariaceae sp. FL0804]|nr:hypothetical protein GGR56DRAFT_666546 [Xylariaceae sp. FL0804]